MPRKKKEVIQLSPEELLEQEKQRGLNSIKDELPYLNEPSYYFGIGDKVRCGARVDCVVDEIFYDGKVYGLKYIVHSDKEGIGDRVAYQIANWMDVRPNEYGNTNLAVNKTVELYFSNVTLSSLLYKCYALGVDFDPEYQRGYVWDNSDKEYLLDSIFHNYDIGKFVFVHLSDAEWIKRGYSYEILDGKQRLNAIMEFYENKISYRGLYYNDLSREDIKRFEGHVVAEANIRESDRDTVLRTFVALNRSGKVMSREQIERVEKMIENE